MIFAASVCLRCCLVVVVVGFFAGVEFIVFSIVFLLLLLSFEQLPALRSSLRSLLSCLVTSEQLYEGSEFTSSSNPLGGMKFEHKKKQKKTQ